MVIAPSILCQCQATASDGGALPVFRREAADDFLEQCSSLGTVIATEVADIYIQGDAGDFRPGVDGKM